MPFIGPWVTPPSETVTVAPHETGSPPPGDYTFHQWGATDQAAVADGTVNVDTLPNQLTAGAAFDGTTWQFWIGHSDLLIDLNALGAAPPPPPNATVEYQNTTSLVGPTFTVTLTPTTYTGALTASQYVFSDANLQPAGDAPPHSLESSGTVFTHGSSGPFTRTYDTTFLSPIFSFVGLPVTVYSVWQETPTVTLPTGSATVDFTLGITVTVQPATYRYVYATPPRLRQFPRDDNLGGAPRQGKANGSTSVQASARQGWRGTYR